MKDVFGEKNDKNEQKENNICLILGVYLSDSTHGQEVLLVNEIAKNSYFKLPGGHLKTGGSFLKKKDYEDYHLRKFFYEQAEWPIKTTELAGRQNFALYTLNNLIIKVNLVSFCQNLPNQHWQKNHSNFRARLVRINEIFNDATSQEIDPLTKNILADFLKRISKKRKTDRCIHLVPVKELNLKAIA